MKISTPNFDKHFFFPSKTSTKENFFPPIEINRNPCEKKQQSPFAEFWRNLELLREKFST
jgi:hypothetical protein